MDKKKKKRLNQPEQVLKSIKADGQILSARPAKKEPSPRLWNADKIAIENSKQLTKKKQ